MNAKDLRIVFMGTPAFAVSALRRLMEDGYNIVAVVTTPDKPAGRGLKVQQSAVKQYAVGAGLPVLQPEKLKDPVFVEEFAALDADLAIVIAFRMLPEVIWAMPKAGTFNLHASLLPQYRGAAPINWAIINGEKLTGVTTFMLNHEIDKGDILGRREVEITPEDTAGTLHDKLMDIGTGLVVETVDMIAAGTAGKIIQPQSDADLKPAPKIFKEDCLIRWHKDPQQIYNLIRGLSPYPAAWAYIVPDGGFCVEKAENEKGETIETGCMHSIVPGDRAVSVKIFAARPEEASYSASYGHIESDGKTYIKVACHGGWVYIDELQMAGKKRMKTGEFLRGFKDIDRYRF